MENQFDYAGGVPVGCNTGAHLIDEQIGHIGIEKDGDLTKLKVRCLRCNRQIDISAPLELNQFIKSDNQPPVTNMQPPAIYRTPTPEVQTQGVAPMEGSDILKRLLG